MSVSEEELQHRVEQFRALFKRSGIKLTHQRLEIFREIARTGEHPSAERIYQGVRKRLPTVSRDTVYRTLWRLVDTGLVSTLGVPSDSIRFDANPRRHHHFVCTRCGKAVDFYEAGYDRLEGSGEVSALGRVESSHVELRGICAECLAKAGREKDGVER